MYQWRGDNDDTNKEYNCYIQLLITLYDYTISIIESQWNISDLTGFLYRLTIISNRKR
jgi:hypothetical protein